MTLSEAKKLGWFFYVGHKPQLAALGNGLYQTRPGKLGAEKTLLNPMGYPYTHRVELRTEHVSEWRKVQKRLLAEIERLEEIQASRRQVTVA